MAWVARPFITPSATLTYSLASLPMNCTGRKAPPALPRIKSAEHRPFLLLPEVWEVMEGGLPISVSCRI